MDVYLSGQDILVVAVISVFLTVVVEALLRRFRPIFGYSFVFEYDASEAERVLARCCAIFPKDVILFRGTSFQRGAMLSVTTSSRGSFEGSLVGQNYDNIICVLTPTHIIAYDLSSIREIRKV